MRRSVSTIEAVSALPLNKPVRRVVYRPLCSGPSSSSFRQAGELRLRKTEDDDNRNSTVYPGLTVPGKGANLLNNPLFNKGSNFPLDERDRLAIRGLVPPRRLGMKKQLMKVKKTLKRLRDPLLQSDYLFSLINSNETLFHRALLENLDEMTSVVYLPTVGQSSKSPSGTSISRSPRGMYFSTRDRGEMVPMIHNWPQREVQVVIISDGASVCGFGDLGVTSMNVSVGKLALYCAAGGIAPHRVLPIALDCGTDNADLQEDPFYLGLQNDRPSHAQYFELMDELLYSIKSRYPGAVIQFEGCGTETSYQTLEKYRHRYRCFDEDIQGTGTTALAAILRCLRKMGGEMRQQRILVLGQGKISEGVKAACANAISFEGGDPHGRIVSLDNFKMQDPEELELLIKTLETTVVVIVDVSYSGILSHGALNTLKKNALKLGSSHRPVVLDMTNHASADIDHEVHQLKLEDEFTRSTFHSWEEKHGEQKSPAREKTDLDSVSVYRGSGPLLSSDRPEGTSLCASVKVFPGIVLGANLSGAKRISDRMLHSAAVALATMGTQEEFDAGLWFPPSDQIHDITARVAAAVLIQAHEEGLAELFSNYYSGPGRSFSLALFKEEFEIAPEERLTIENVTPFIQKKMYHPHYLPLVEAGFGVRK